MRIKRHSGRQIPSALLLGSASSRSILHPSSIVHSNEERKREEGRGKREDAKANVSQSHDRFRHGMNGMMI